MVIFLTFKNLFIFFKKRFRDVLHRICQYVVLVLDGVEHKVAVIIAVFNPRPDKFRPEFFSAFEIYDFTIYCTWALRICDEAERQKRRKNICARSRLEGNRDTKNNSCFLKFNSCSPTHFFFLQKVFTAVSRVRNWKICGKSLATNEKC